MNNPIISSNKGMFFKKLLTIGIPSYDRLEELAKLVSQVYDNNLLKYVNLLIIDDGKQKNVNDHFRNNYSQIYPFIKILENNGNLGYASTFFRIFEECETDFLLIMADDDIIEPNSFDKLINYIEKNGPDFISPQFFRKSTMERGVKTSRDILIDEYRSCCNHAPGLVYKISSCLPFLDYLKCRLKNGKTDVMIYPQVTLVIYLLHSMKRCVWLNFPTAYEGGNLPSEIRDSNGSNYWEFIPRCRQLIDFEELLLTLEKNEVSIRMLELHRTTAYTEIKGSLMISSPGLGVAFDRSSHFAIYKNIIKINKIIGFMRNFYKKFDSSFLKIYSASDKH